MDFIKTFDKVPYVGLVQKIRGHGIQGVLANWIQNCRGDRQQVVDKGCFFDWKSVTSDIPRTSVLGLLLYAVQITVFDKHACGLRSKLVEW